MYQLVVHIHLSDIDRLYWEKLQRHTLCRILRMSVNGASRIFSFASWVIYVPIGCRPPYIGYCLPLLGKTTATCSLPHYGNERQETINNLELRILHNIFSDWLQTSIYQIFAAFTGKNNSEMLPGAS